MSTSARSLLPDVTRAIASCELAVAPMVTARPSLPNRPLTCAITKGAATASIGRSSVNWTCDRLLVVGRAWRARTRETAEACEQGQDEAECVGPTYAH